MTQGLGALARSLGGQVPAWFRCQLCEAPAAGVLCALCASDWQSSAAQPRCAHCAITLTDGALSRWCADCLRQPPPWHSACALADYAPPLDALITHMKFGLQPSLARWLGQQLGGHLLSQAAHQADWSWQAVDDWVPVPLSKERLRARGFNQAWEMLHGMRRVLTSVDATWSAKLRVDVLQRLRDTAPQSSLHDHHERHRNVQGAFVVTRAVAGRSIALVDDVLTSGSTCAEVTRTLLRAGARAVHVCVALRTPRHPR